MVRSFLCCCVSLSPREDWFLAWDTAVKLAHSGIVLMHFLAELINFLRDHLVCMLLVPEHHLHEVELALDETTRANVRVDIGDLTCFDTTTDGLERLLEVATLLALSSCFLILCGAVRVQDHTIDITERLIRTEHAEGAPMLVRFDLVVKDSTDLVNFDDGCPGVVVNDAILLIVVEHTLLLQSCVSRVLLVMGKRVFMSDCDVGVDDGIGSRDSSHAGRVVSL